MKPTAKRAGGFGVEYDAIRRAAWRPMYVRGTGMTPHVRLEYRYDVQCTNITSNAHEDGDVLCASRIPTQHPSGVILLWLPLAPSGHISAVWQQVHQKQKG